MSLKRVELETKVETRAIDCTLCIIVFYCIYLSIYLSTTACELVLPQTTTWDSVSPQLQSKYELPVYKFRALLQHVYESKTPIPACV